MAAYTITFRGVKEVIKSLTIFDGEDWDGRPVDNEYDAADLAHDRLIERYPDIDWQDRDWVVHNGRA